MKTRNRSRSANLLKIAVAAAIGGLFSLPAAVHAQALTGTSLSVTGPADIQGNTLMFGSWSTNPNRPGVSASFSDDGTNSTLRLLASGSSNTWLWATTGSSGTPSSSMTLDSSNRLSLYSTTNSTTPVIVLDPSLGSIAINGVPLAASIFAGAGHDSVVLGYDNTSSGPYSTAMGYQNQATGYCSTATGQLTTASNNMDTATGYDTVASGGQCFAGGYGSQATGWTSVAIGVCCSALGPNAVALGGWSYAAGDYSTALGCGNGAYGGSSTALGTNTTAQGGNSLSMGWLSVVNGNNSFSGGHQTYVDSDNSLAMGDGYTAIWAADSLALGYNAVTYKTCSMAMGGWVATSGNYSQAFGEYSTANGDCSHALGYSISAMSYAQTVLGQFNYLPNPTNPTAWNPNDELFTIGNGSSPQNPSDALVVKKNGDTTIYGKVTVSGTNGGNGGIVVTGTMDATSGIMVASGNNQLVLIPQQGDLSMGNFHSGALPQ